jgi:hypothetical protein
MFSRPRRLAAPAVGLAALLTLTACSAGSLGSSSDDSGSGAGTPPATASASGTPIADAPTAAPTAGQKVSGATLGAQIAAKAATDRSETFAIITQGAQTLAANGQSKGTGNATALTLSATIAGAQALQIIRAGGVIYLKSPTPVAGKPWVKITNSSKDLFRPLYDQVFKGLEVAGDVNETAGVIKTLGSFTSAGVEVVDGVRTTKYVAQPPATKGIKLVPQAFSALTTEELKGAKTTIAIWVEPDGRLHRLTTVFSGLGTAKSTSLVTYSGWGAPVSVAAPPAGQVTTLTRPAT